MYVLQPCKHCGGQPETFRIERWGWIVKDDQRWVVRCQDCGVKVRHRVKTKAWDRWQAELEAK